MINSWMLYLCETTLGKLFTHVSVTNSIIQCTLQAVMFCGCESHTGTDSMVYSSMNSVATRREMNTKDPKTGPLTGISRSQDFSTLNISETTVDIAAVTIEP